MALLELVTMVSLALMESTLVILVLLHRRIVMRWQQRRSAATTPAAPSLARQGASLTTAITTAEPLAIISPSNPPTPSSTSRHARSASAGGASTPTTPTKASRSPSCPSPPCRSVSAPGKAQCYTVHAAPARSSCCSSPAPSVPCTWTSPLAAAAPSDAARPVRLLLLPASPIDICTTSTGTCSWARQEEDEQDGPESPGSPPLSPVMAPYALFMGTGRTPEAASTVFDNEAYGSTTTSPLFGVRRVRFTLPADADCGDGVVHVTASGGGRSPSSLAPKPKPAHKPATATTTTAAVPPRSPARITRVGRAAAPPRPQAKTLWRPVFKPTSPLPRLARQQPKTLQARPTAPKQRSHMLRAALAAACRPAAATAIGPAVSSPMAPHYMRATAASAAKAMARRAL